MSFYWGIKAIDIDRYQWTIVIKYCYFVFGGGGGDAVCAYVHAHFGYSVSL